MPHGHHGPGENPEEIRVFADHHLMGGIPLPVVVDQGSGDDEAWVRFASQSQVVGAELNYTCDTGKWQERKWHIIPAELEPAGSARARIPAEATAFYLNLVDSRNCVVSAEHQERQ
jgi:hypothetical protein